MMKKVFILLFSYALILFVTIISCGCPTPVDYYYRLLEVSLTNTELKVELQDSTIVNQSDYAILLSMKRDVIAQRENTLSMFFSATAYAKKCIGDIDHGLKTDVVSFELTCDKEILNTSPGIPLSLDNIAFNSRGEIITIDAWLDIINDGEHPFSGYESWYIEFLEDINSDEYLKFEIALEMADGNKYQATTEYVKIE